MRTHVRFRSATFVVEAPRDRRSAPRPPGEALAAWLVDGLGRLGAAPSSCTAEDWGYAIEFGAERIAWLGCGRVDGSSDQWLCFCDVRRRLVDRLAPRERGRMQLESLVRALDAIVSREPSITDVEWFESDRSGVEANHAAAPFT
jgi:hypothetical protein